VRKVIRPVEGTNAGPEATHISPAVPAAEPAEGRKHALIVGIARYASKEIAPLRGVPADVQAVYSRFIDEAGLEIPRANVRILLDEAATREAILNELVALNDRVGPNDMAIVYYAGHGDIATGAKGEALGNHLVPYDARLLPAPARLDPASGIAIKELQDKLQSNRARELLLVLDSCFSGGASLSHAQVDAARLRSSRDDLERLKDAAPGRAVLTSTAPNEEALELPELGHGLFTYAFLKALDVDADHDGKVTIYGMFPYIASFVQAEAQKRGRRQTPQMYMSGGAVFKLRSTEARQRVKLTVTYLGAGAPQEVEGEAKAPAAPTPVEGARQFAVHVEAKDQPVPLRVYVFRIVVTRDGVASAMLIPDGANKRPPPATVADGRPARFPVPEQTGERAEAIAEPERDAYVVYVALASEARIPLAEAAEIERRLREAALAEAPVDLARTLAAHLAAEDVLKQAAIRYAFVKQSRGGTPR
jgi:uncharacterized caspase-like protein